MQVIPIIPIIILIFFGQDNNNNLIKKYKLYRTKLDQINTFTKLEKIITNRKNHFRKDIHST